MVDNVITDIQDYIEEHLHDEITLYMIAKHIHYSPWHTSSIFKEKMNISLFEYIRQRRLTEAALELRDTKKSVTTVAFDFSFGSHESFTRSFSKVFGLTPKKYSKIKPPIQMFLHTPYDDISKILKEANDYMPKKLDTLFIQVIDKPKRKMLIKRGETATEYFEFCDEVGCDVLGVPTSIKEALNEPVGLWMPESLRNGKSEYIQGVEVPMEYDHHFEGYEYIILEPQKYMIFQGPPFEDEEFATAIKDVWHTLESFDPSLYGYEFDYESAPKFQLSPLGYRGYIEGIPVKEKQ